MPSDQTTPRERLLWLRFRRWPRRLGPCRHVSLSDWLHMMAQRKKNTLWAQMARRKRVFRRARA